MVLSKKPEQIAHYSLPYKELSKIHVIADLYLSLRVESVTAVYLQTRENIKLAVWQEYFDVIHRNHRRMKKIT